MQLFVEKKAKDGSKTYSVDPKKLFPGASAPSIDKFHKSFSELIATSSPMEAVRKIRESKAKYDIAQNPKAAAEEIKKDIDKLDAAPAVKENLKSVATVISDAVDNVSKDKGNDDLVRGLFENDVGMKEMKVPTTKEELEAEIRPMLEAAPKESIVNVKLPESDASWSDGVVLGWRRVSNSKYVNDQ